MDDRAPVERTFTLFPGLVQAQVFTDDLSGVDLCNDFQADVVTPLVIELLMASSVPHERVLSDRWMVCLSKSSQMGSFSWISSPFLLI